MLSVHGRRRSVGQGDQSLLDGTTENILPDEMFLLMEVDEEYSRLSSRRSETQRCTTVGERHSTRRSTRRSTLDDSFLDVAKYKRIPWSSERRSSRRSSCSHGADYMPDGELAGEEAPALVAGISSMLNLRERVEHHKKEGYLSVMNVEYIAPNRGARSKQDISSASQKCDDIILPEQMVPVAPSKPRPPESAKGSRPHLRHRQIKSAVQGNATGMTI